MTTPSRSTGHHNQPGTSSDFPSAPGTTVKTKIERGDRYSAPEVYILEMGILHSIRGDEALTHLKHNGIRTRNLKDGFEYILVRIHIGYYSRGRGFGQAAKPYVIEKDFFYCTSEDGQTVFDLPIFDKPLLDHVTGKSLNPGQSLEGWIALEVPAKERFPLLAFKREYRENTYGIWPPIWFSLYPNVA